MVKKLFGYTIKKEKDCWIAIKPGENGRMPDVILSLSNSWLDQENLKPNPLKETRLLDLLYLHMLRQEQENRKKEKENGK